ELVATDDAIRRPRVWLCPIRTGRDDRIEAIAARTAFAHPELELECKLSLGDAVGQTGQQGLEGFVGDRARPPDAVDLSGVLDATRVLHERAGRHELDPVE